MTLDYSATQSSAELLKKLGQTPIEHHYEMLHTNDIEHLKNHARIAQVQPANNIQVVNIYYQGEVAGSLPELYTRESVWLRLQNVAAILEPHAGLMIYDTFRTIETQAALFQQFHDEIQQRHPELNAEELDRMTRLYVSHPTDKTHREIPLHNSGGAVDLAIYDVKTGEAWDFGSAFDDPEEISHTSYFEAPFDASKNISETRWLEVRKNRRIFFHLMKQQGFVNYHFEWWHYDLGDCHWADVHGIPWIYDSMESLIKKI